MIKTLFTIILFISNYSISNGIALKPENIDPGGATILKDNGTGLTQFDNIMKYTTDTIFTMLWIIVVGSFIYIGFKFVTAKGNPEEFKKAWTNVVYTIVGILMVSGAWAIVRLVAGIDF